MMKCLLTQVLLSAALLSASALAAPVDREVLASRPHTNFRGWERHPEPAPARSPIHFTLYLTREGLPSLQSALRQVSDPESMSYGSFLTKDEVDKLVHALPTSRAAVLRWLRGWGDRVSLEEDADTISVKTTAAVASQMFRVPFHRYEHRTTGKQQLRAAGHVTMPRWLRKHVQLVVGLTELWHGRQGGRARREMKNSDDNDVKVTPAVLRKFYGVPESEVNSSPDNLQAIIAFDDSFCDACLTNFTKTHGLPTPNLTRHGPDCVNHPPSGQKVCDEVESDLDIQYVTAMGVGTPTLFYNNEPQSTWVLGFSQAALSFSPMPLVMSVSYGWAELKQCEIAIEKCDTLGYSSAAYVNATNVNFQKLSAMGVSILVSDGDDGASSNSPDGANSLDPSRWCGGSPWTCYPHTSSACGEIELVNTNDASAPHCPWPAGNEDGDLCEWLYLVKPDFYQPSDIIKALQTANPTCELDISYDGSYGVHMYSKCSCDEITLSHNGIVAQTFKFNSSARIFWADFPTSSPYVTSVGATAFKSKDGVTVEAEHVASIVDGAIITTGGGFSAIFEQPSWQQEAVEGWAMDAPTAAKPPPSSYDAAKRGYPDIALNGHNYQVVIEEKHEMKSGGVDGTSASSPALAGIISLLNGQLLAAGKTGLGFLNPLLYKMWKDHPTSSGFRDITYGDNKCTRNFCFLYGYNATKGWDPTSGLGSINYPAFKEYVLAAKGL